jgi:DNA-binding transcriptional ArsR family regulator
MHPVLLEGTMRELSKTPASGEQRAREVQLKALANARRLQILAWLRDPRAHFPEQVDGDLVEDGVCGLFIARKLGVSQPTAHQHLKALADAGFISSRRIKQWTFFKRNEAALRDAQKLTDML